MICRVNFKHATCCWKVEMQSVRARGSHPRDLGFESLRAHLAGQDQEPFRCGFGWKCIRGVDRPCLLKPNVACPSKREALPTIKGASHLVALCKPLNHVRAAVLSFD